MYLQPKDEIVCRMSVACCSFQCCKLDAPRTAHGWPTWPSKNAEKEVAGNKEADRLVAGSNRVEWTDS